MDFFNAQQPSPDDEIRAAVLAHQVRRKQANQFRGHVVAIHRGDVVSEVEIETTAGVVGAIVTSSSIDRLDLRIGDEALALFKAIEVMIAKVEKLDIPGAPQPQRRSYHPTGLRFA